jgi:DNA-binding CsgD family transcriptional regulator
MKRLTSREREIVLALAEGLSNEHAGRRLNISEGTVKVHLHNIYSKLGVKNRTASAMLAHTELVSPECSLHLSWTREELPTDPPQAPFWLMSPCPYLKEETGLCNRGWQKQ